MSELLNDLKDERVEGSYAVLQYSNFDYWVHWDDIEEIVEKHEKQPTLNDNQQIVLEWLKEEYQRSMWTSPFGAVYSVINKYEYVIRSKLSKTEQAQVLEAFSQWALEQEAE